MSKATLTKNGYPADGLESKPCEDVNLEDADIIINITGQPGQAVFQDTSKVEDWYVEDPYGSDDKTYQRIFEDIERRVVELVGRVRMSAAGEFKPRNTREKGNVLRIDGGRASDNGQG
jgi:protein-tyrosine-phosphatase